MFIIYFYTIFHKFSLAPAHLPYTPLYCVMSSLNMMYQHLPAALLFLTSAILPSSFGPHNSVHLILAALFDTELR